MYVHVGGTDFAVADVPDDVAIKRDNLNKAAEKEEIKGKKKLLAKQITRLQSKKSKSNWNALRWPKNCVKWRNQHENN